MDTNQVTAALAPRTLRTYEKAWLALRARGEVELDIADPLFIPRIRKAIIKEKYLDDGFRLMNEFEPYYLWFHYDEKSKVLQIELRAKLGLVAMRG